MFSLRGRSENYRPTGIHHKSCFHRNQVLTACDLNPFFTLFFFFVDSLLKTVLRNLVAQNCDFEEVDDALKKKHFPPVS